MNTQCKGSHLQVRTGDFTENRTRRHPDLESSASKTVRTKRLLLKPPSLRYSVIAAELTETGEGGNVHLAGN